MTGERAPGTPPAAAKLIAMVWAHWDSHLVRQTAQMGLADKFGGDARDADELCAEYGMHAPSFRRFLRALTGVGILSEIAPRRYVLTDMGEALKTGAPGAARSTITWMLGEVCSALWNDMDYSLRTGKPTFEKQHGKECFDYFKENPALAELFTETMVGLNGQEPAAVASAYDFSGIGSLVDVGGASGNMLAQILSRHPGVRGVLYDLPHVVASAPPLLQSFGVSDRVAIQGGSFFESVPAGHDAYLMSHIIHDWDQQTCATLLGRCREAMKPDARLLVVEMVLPEGDAPHTGKLSDMMMLLALRGQERTAREYDALLSANGFRMTRIVPTDSAVSVVEAMRT